MTPLPPPPRQVSDVVRRTISKVLAKAKGEGSATKGSSRSRGRDKSRGHAFSGSNGADHESGDGHRASSNGGQREQAGWEKVKPARSDSSVRASAVAALSHSSSLMPFSRSGAQTEEELLSAAEASIAAAAWTPTAAAKPRLTGHKGSSSRTISDRKRNGSGADRDTTSSAAAQSNGNSVTPAAAAPASAASAVAAAPTNVPDQPRPSRSPRADHAESTAGFSAPERARAADGAATVPSLQRKLWSPPASATDRELNDLRRQIKDLALAVVVAEKRDMEGRLALRQALAESEKRAEGVGAAAQARSKKLDVLVRVRCPGRCTGVGVGDGGGVRHYFGILVLVLLVSGLGLMLMFVSLSVWMLVWLLSSLLLLVVIGLVFAVFGGVGVYFVAVVSRGGKRSATLALARRTAGVVVVVVAIVLLGCARGLLLLLPDRQRTCPGRVLFEVAFLGRELMFALIGVSDQAPQVLLCRL